MEVCPVHIRHYGHKIQYIQHSVAHFEVSGRQNEEAVAAAFFGPSQKKMEAYISTIQQEGVNIQNELNSSNSDLKKQIADVRTQLRQLELSLVKNEDPLRKRLKVLDRAMKSYKERKTRLQEMQLKWDSFRQFVNEQKHEHIHDMFLVNRFTVDFYNSRTSGYYSNRGGINDVNLLSYGHPHVREKDEVEFNHYTAYEIIAREEEMTREQKYIAIDYMFAEFMKHGDMTLLY